MMRLNIFFLTALSVLLVGCHSHKELTFSYITTNSAPVKGEDPAAQAQLAQAAVDATHSLQQVSSMRLALHPGITPPPALDAKRIGMTQETSLDWTGPVEPLLKRIANASHYRLRVLGAQPAIPVIVSMNVVRVPLADILRDASYQVSQKARITVYPATRIIELRYEPV